jgi:hypothetical protein
MKNITLSIDEKVLTAVRRYAVEKNSSVNGIVREYLTGLAERQDRASQVRRELRRLSDRSKARIGRRSWNRDQLHER